MPAVESDSPMARRRGEKSRHPVFALERGHFQMEIDLSGHPMLTLECDHRRARVRGDVSCHSIVALEREHFRAERRDVWSPR